MTLLQLFLLDERGSATIEYGMLAAFISIAAVGALAAVGDGIGSALQELAEAFSGFTALSVED